MFRFLYVITLNNNSPIHADLQTLSFRYRVFQFSGHVSISVYISHFALLNETVTFHGHGYIQSIFDSVPSIKGKQRVEKSTHKKEVRNCFFFFAGTITGVGMQ